MNHRDVSPYHLALAEVQMVSRQRLLGLMAAAFLAFPLVLSGPALAQSAEPTTADRPPIDRILIHLPHGIVPAPLVSYDRLVETNLLGNPTQLHGTADLPQKMTAVETQLREGGALAFARLSDGIRTPIPEWGDLYAVSLSIPLARSEADDLVARINREAGEMIAEVDVFFEPLVAPGFDWGAQQISRTAPGLQLDSYPPGLDPTLGGSAFLPDDPLFVDGSQWGLHNEGTGPYGGVADIDVNAPEAWALYSGNSSIVIGVVDTGIDPGQPDINSQLKDGSDRIIAVLKSYSGAGTGVDSVGHGTMVAGVMAALTNNGPLLDGRGVAGMLGGSGNDSVGCRLVTVKATSGHSTVVRGSDLSRGILIAHDNGARSINLSFASLDASSVVLAALKSVSTRGTIVVSGAGNGADSRLFYPAAFAPLGVTVSVGAITSAGELAIFSTRGDQIDVVGPGQDIWSTYLTYENAFGSTFRNFLSTSGTSFSAPFVTGIAGLAIGLEPDLVANDFQEIARRTARDIGPPGKDSEFGYGIIDAEAIVRALLPPRQVLHGVTPVQSWFFTGEESLRVTNSRISRGGRPLDGDYLAEVWEVRADVRPIPGLLEVPVAWVRFSGNGGWTDGPAHNENLSGGEMVPGSADLLGFELRSHVFFIDQPPNGCPSCPPIGWLPRPPEEVVIDWSALAKVDAPPVLTVLSPTGGEVWLVDSEQMVSWQASDPDRIDRIEIRLDQGNGGEPELLGVSSSPSGSLQIQVPCTSGDGQSNLLVIAVDESGTQGDQTTQAVSIQLNGRICGGEVAQFALPIANPAHGTAIFAYRIPDPGTSAFAQLSIFDGRGRRVATLLRSAGLPPGPGEIRWDGQTDDGARVNSGVYYAVFTVGSERQVDRFVYLR